MNKDMVATTASVVSIATSGVPRNDDKRIMPSFLDRHAKAGWLFLGLLAIGLWFWANRYRDIKPGWGNSFWAYDTWTHQVVQIQK